MTDERSNMPIAENWHLDKKIPIGLMVGLLGQCVVFSWWAATMDNRVSMQAEVSERQAEQIEALRLQTQTLSVGAASVSANLQALTQSVQELKEGQKEISVLLRELAQKGR
jgi:DNA polymerase III delta subunit